MTTLIEKLKQKLKGFFTMTPEQIAYAEHELRLLCGLPFFCEKEIKCPGWEWIQLYYPFWHFVCHCPYFRADKCIMSDEEKQIATQNLELLKKA